jgi:WD40 repeat protein
MKAIKHSFIGHQGRCFDVRYSCQGGLAMSASEDGSVKMWDVNSRKCLFTFDHGE